MSVPRVGIVVVNYNGGDLTIDCLRSLVRTAWPAGQLRVVLVDNASSDGVAARVRSELPVVRVVERDTNDGFGAACNVGIAHLGDVDAVALGEQRREGRAGLARAPGARRWMRSRG